MGDIHEDEVMGEVAEAQMAIGDEILDQRELKLAITYANFPQGYLSIDGMTVMQAQMQTFIESIPEDEWKPSFTKNVWEKGVWKIACVNAASQNWLIENLKIFNSSGIEMIVLPSNSLPIILYRANFPASTLPSARNDTSILDQVSTQLRTKNTLLDMSYWRTNASQELADNSLTIIYEIDAISRKVIEDHDCLLNFGDSTILFEALEIEAIDRQRGVIFGNQMEAEDDVEYFVVEQYEEA